MKGQIKKPIVKTKSPKRVKKESKVRHRQSKGIDEVDYGLYMDLGLIIYMKVIREYSVGKFIS